jgi:O-antigen ligase
MDTVRVAIDNPYLIALLLALFGYLIYQGRITAVLGGFYAASNWIFNADIGPVALLRVFVAVMACTALVAVLRKKGSVGRTLRSPQIVTTILLVVIWSLSIALKTLNTPDALPGEMLRGFLVYTLLPTALLLIFVNELADVRQFALGFVVCTTGTAIGAVLIVPTFFLGQLGLVLGLGGGEYLSFSWGLAMGILFGVGAFFVVRRKGLRAMFLTMSGICCVVLLMSAARQSVLALVIALTYVFWVLVRRHGQARAILSVVIVFVVLGGTLYFATDLGQGLLIDKWNKSDDDAVIRKQYWNAGWNVFLEHPATGAGLRYMPDETDSAHNVLIDILASQGLLGFMFLSAFTSLTLSALRRGANRETEREAQLWRTILISILIFTAVHSFASGGMIAEPEFFWAPVLLMLLASIAVPALNSEYLESAIPGMIPYREQQ